MARALPPPGISRICTDSHISIIAIRGRCADGRPVITGGEHPYSKNRWVPGVQIGYEHTFIHQGADFLTALGEGKPLAPNFRDGLATDYVTDAEVRKIQAMGERPRLIAGLKTGTAAPIR